MNMAILRGLPLLIFGLAGSLGAQTTRPDVAGSARSGIRAGNAAYIEAFRRADGRALAQVYDPSGSRLNEGGQVIRGRDAIANDVGKFVERVGPVQVTLDTKEVWVIDDSAYETGIWSYTFHPPGRTEQQIGGHYVTVWKRQPQGEWKIWADMGVPGT